MTRSIGDATLSVKTIASKKNKPHGRQNIKYEGCVCEAQSDKAIVYLQI